MKREHYAVNVDLEKFKELSKEGNVIPVGTELVLDVETPVSVFKKLKDRGYGYLLESAEVHDQVGRYSFVGCDPEVVIRTREDRVEIERNGEVEVRKQDRDPLEELKRVMSGYRAVGDFGEQAFRGGAVGYLGYDAVRFFETRVPVVEEDPLGVPDAVFVLARILVIFDHRYRKMRILSLAYLDDKKSPEEVYEDAILRLEEVLQELETPDGMVRISTGLEAEECEIRSNTTEEEYKQMVLKGQAYIRAGDIFQFVPSQRFEATYSGDEVSLYRALRFVNPSPYMFCLNFGDAFSLVGSSPEVHVRMQNEKIEIRPIAGTRLRGKNEEEDEANAEDLLADPKERAEHIMLVDLARNDVGRIAEYGSVKVTDLMIIERYSHVMHIVSNVEGHLSGDNDCYDVLRATFPAGTVSGSPKVRAMEIIAEVEKNKRGTYAGAVAYVGFDGNLDSCIVLRTVLMKDGKAYVQAGAGIVADSTPDGEYQETVNKARGMMKAIGLARRIARLQEG